MFCNKCGAQIADDSLFCPKCGAPVSHNDNTIRREVFAGEVIKCPVCGTEIPSFMAICPGCGHEINSAQVSSSFKEFTNKIIECDTVIAISKKAKSGWSTWGFWAKIGWIFINLYLGFIPLIIYCLRRVFGVNKPAPLTPEEANKAHLILSFPFPNDRENILEALIFIKSQVSKLASEKIDTNTKRWISIWKDKATQLYDRAQMMFKDDQIAKAAYEDILSNEAKVKKALLVKHIILITILVVPTVLFIIYALVTQS